jgi:hypothetical protein
MGCKSESARVLTSPTRYYADKIAIITDAQIAATDSCTETTEVAALSSGTTTMELCATGFRQLKLISGVSKFVAEGGE